MSKEILEVKDELYYYDGPVFVILKDAKKLWAAMWVDEVDGWRQFVATRVSEEEVKNIRLLNTPIRNLFENRPWREVILGEKGFQFGTTSGDRLPEEHLSTPNALLYDRPANTLATDSEADIEI